MRTGKTYGALASSAGCGRRRTVRSGYPPGELNLRAKIEQMLRMLSIALLAALGLLAQQAPEPVKKSAESWLPLIDSAQYGVSWDRAADTFKKAVTKDKWSDAAKQARAPLGKFKSRTLSLAQPAQDPPNAPPGNYMIIQFNSDFDYKNGAIETVILFEQSKNQWRVAGYFIK